MIVGEDDVGVLDPSGDRAEETVVGTGHAATLRPARDRVVPASYDRAIDQHAPIPTYGLDIETDTRVDGLDPAVSPVVAVAVTGTGFEQVLDGDEAHILRALDELLTTIEPGVLVTWNGGAFDLPFLADRARRIDVELGLRLHLDPTLPGRHDPLLGHEGTYRAGWYAHRHLDGYRLFRADVGAALGYPCGLKPLARMVGLPVVEVDRARIHHLDDADRRAYVASDARLARALVLRRWPTAVRAIDPEVTARTGAPAGQPIGS